MSTALAEAFKVVGYRSPLDRLKDLAADTLLGGESLWLKDRIEIRDDPVYRTKVLEIAMEAARLNPRNFEAARDQFYKAVKKDADLLWALFEPYRSLAADRMLRDGYQLLSVQERRVVDGALIKKDAAKAAGGGHGCCDTQKRSAPAAPQDATPQAERQSEGASTATTSTCLSPPRSNLTALADKQAARARTSAAVQVKLTRLDTVMVDGKPIGDCTVAEVRAWAARREADKRAAGRDAQFALNLVANLQGDVVIRQHWAPMLNDVDQMYDRAEADHAA